MFSRTAYDNSGPTEVAVLEVVRADSDDESPDEFIPLQTSDLRGVVTGPLASLSLTQTFRFSRAQSPDPLEALYRFPIPGDAAVTGVRVEFADVAIWSELKARADAERDYSEAREAGKQAVLTTRESPDVFTLHVTGLKPDEAISIETFYVQVARPAATGWSLRVPLTIGPRYSRSDERDSPHAQGQPLALALDPGHRFALDVTLLGAAEVHSPTHDLAPTRDGERWQVRLAADSVIPDRDFLLTWRPAQAVDRPALDIHLHRAEGSEWTYFLAQVTPPRTSALQRVRREIVLLVDHSGSMTGPKWEAADWAVHRFLSSLSPDSAFALGVFHDRTTWFTPHPQQATPDRLAAAIAFLGSRKDSGGTELGVALEQALRMQRVAGDFARHVLIITDAEVSDSARILRLTDEHAQHADRRRISVLCIDAAPNAFLVHELVERGGGTAHFLTSDPNAEDITTALDDTLREWEEPLLTNVSLSVSGATVEAANRPIIHRSNGVSQIDLGDLPAGQPIWVVGRTRHAESALEFHLEAAGRTLASQQLDRPTRIDRPAIRAFFGARRILALEWAINGMLDRATVDATLQRLGYSRDDLTPPTTPGDTPIYAENQRAETHADLDHLLVRESLSFGLASAATAFVAVRQEADAPIRRSLLIPNALPHGWSTGFLGGGMPKLAVAAMPPLPASPPTKYASRAASLIAEDLSPVTRHIDLFSGRPDLASGSAVLYEASSSELARLQSLHALRRLIWEFTSSAPTADKIDPELTLLLYVDDPTTPRARVRIADLVRQSGERPINVAVQATQLVRLVLEDANGAWRDKAPAFTVRVEG